LSPFYSKIHKINLNTVNFNGEKWHFILSNENYTENLFPISINKLKTQLSQQLQNQNPKHYGTIKIEPTKQTKFSKHKSISSPKDNFTFFFLCFFIYLLK
jgi:hypothetical protein